MFIIALNGYKYNRCKNRFIKLQEVNMERLVGNKAPDFTLQACKGDGSDFKEVKLSDYSGKWLVLFFYPLDFTDV